MKQIVLNNKKLSEYEYLVKNQVVIADVVDCMKYRLGV